MKITGYENEKAQIYQLRSMLENAGTYRKCGVRIPKGLLLCGEPGVGKTVLAKAIAGDGINLVELKASDCCSSDPAGTIKQAFTDAKSSAPCVLLIDEIDKMAAIEMFYATDESSNVNKILLRELDSLSAADDVLVAATCNDMKCLGEAMVRPGRFDRIISVPLPDEATRKAIIADYFGSISIENQLDYGYIARLTAGYSGARIECLANEVGVAVLSRSGNVIMLSDVREAMERMDFSCDSTDNRKDEAERYKLAVHEAGHCLTTMILRPDAVVDVTIKPRGSSGGHSSSIGLSERFTAADEVIDIIAESLAGHVAERVVLGSCGIGSGADLARASRYVNRLVCINGAYGYRYLCENSIVLEAMPDSQKKEIADLKVEILEEQDKRVESIINGHRRLFDAIVNELVYRQTLTKADLEDIMADVEGSEAA